MIVINACIYNSTNLGTIETEKLNKELKLLNIEQFINVFTIPRFIAELEANKDKEILLFSNFPPKELYIKNGVSQSEIDKFAGNLSDWNVPEYQISAELIKYVCMKYKFKAIHFITGAHKLVVSDSLILSLTGNTTTTIKRKHDWTESDINYEVSLRFYLIQKIKEAIESNSL